MNWPVAMAVGLAGVAGLVAAELAMPWQVFQSEGATVCLEATNVPGAFRVTGQGPTNSYVGVYQTRPVEPAKSYRAVLRKQVIQSGGGRGQWSLEWKDAGGGEIRRVWGPDWSLAGVEDRPQALVVTGTAPPQAATAHLVVTFFPEPTPATNGVFVIFDVTWETQ